jgi:hypothetical protein
VGAAVKSGKANRRTFCKEVDGMDLKNIFNVGYQGFPDGSVSFFSDRIAELTGYGKEEFNNKSCTRKIMPRH